MIKKFPYVYSQLTRHGTTVWYFRRGKTCKRIKAPIGSSKFKEEYIEALTGGAVEASSVVIHKGTLKWLINQYQHSNVFNTLSANSRRNYNGHLKRLIEKRGSLPLHKVTQSFIQNSVDHRSNKVASSVLFLATMRGLYKWAVERNLVKSDPTVGVKTPKLKTKGFATWTIEQIEQFRKYHPIGTKARLAMEMMLFLGLRRSDVMRVGAQHIKDGVFSIQTKKTGTQVTIPIAGTLQKCIEATRCTGEVLLSSPSGKKYASEESFGIWFKNQCKKADLPNQCTAHGLRKAGATIMANAGVSSHELMAMYGWSKLSMAEVYTKEADKKKLSSNAIKALSKSI
ncbi:integrase [Candidatus Liberibacter solanacearum]|uniref:Integrase n=1 Tax=Candidatus Liberibacter solanacearum TaxID=556287 RepID=A0A424FNI2_9HYPH|nr:tyrosine-type recombinase/integrase [Candidatus Liberibacter solanacearum]RPD37677.1 integrase [Candidatus Liberibacter solanacearum]